MCVCVHVAALLPLYLSKYTHRPQVLPLFGGFAAPSVCCFRTSFLLRRVLVCFASSYCTALEWPTSGSQRLLFTAWQPRHLPLHLSSHGGLYLYIVNCSGCSRTQGPVSTSRPTALPHLELVLAPSGFCCLPVTRTEATPLFALSR